jgi:restriction system protein
VEQIDSKISLIDGQQLVQLMTEYNIGVETKQDYKLKRLDNDYFEED